LILELHNYKCTESVRLHSDLSGHNAIKIYRSLFSFEGFLGGSFLRNFKRIHELQEEQKKNQVLPVGYYIGLTESPSLPPIPTSRQSLPV